MPQLVSDLLDAMEEIKPGAGRALIKDLTADWLLDKLEIVS